MSNQEILTKAIQKAVEGGWEHRNGWTYLANYKKPAPFNSVQFIDEVGEVWHMPIESLIFTHDFAKALWGEEDADGQHYYAINNSSQIETPNWQHHLMQMVIADDAITYLGENI